MRPRLRSSKRSRPGGSAGFTIIEVVLAMGLLLLGMSAILGLLSFGAALARTAALRTGAASAIEAVVAELEESLFPLQVDPDTGIARAGEPHVIQGRPVPGHPGLVYNAEPIAVRGSDDGPDVPQRYRVDIDITWQSGGRRRAKTFTALLLREVPFGERLRRQFIQRDLDPLGSSLPPPAVEPSAAKP